MRPLFLLASFGSYSVRIEKFADKMPPGGLVHVKVVTTEDRTRAKAAHTTFQFSLDVSTPEGLATVPEQIRLALKANKGRVIDFFQSMDDDGSGTISRKEFILELSELGLSDYQEQVAQVFDYLDGNGSGSLDYTELSAMLRGSKPLPVGGGKTQKEAEWWLRKVPEDVRQVSSPYLPVVISSNRRLQGGSIHAWQFTPEVFVGTNRCSSKLAIIMHAAHASTMLSQPTPGGRVLFPSSVLRSDFVQRHLVSEGYGVLAFEAHAFGAAWDEAGEGATAALLAVFEYVSRHVQLRYCRVAVFASGVGATAALVASSRVPALFEQRLKLVCAYEPTLERTSRGLWGEGSRALDDGTLPVMEDQTAVTADQLEAELLSQCVPRLQVFVLLVSPMAEALKLPKWHALHKLLLTNNQACEVLLHPRSASDDIEYFSQQPIMLVKHLQAHMGGNGDLYEQVVLHSPRSPRSPRPSPRQTRPNSPRNTQLPTLSPRAPPRRPANSPRKPKPRNTPLPTLSPRVRIG